MCPPWIRTYTFYRPFLLHIIGQAPTPASAMEAALPIAILCCCCLLCFLSFWSPRTTTFLHDSSVNESTNRYRTTALRETIKWWIMNGFKSVDNKGYVGGGKHWNELSNVVDDRFELGSELMTVKWRWDTYNRIQSPNMSEPGSNKILYFIHCICIRDYIGASVTDGWHCVCVIRFNRLEWEIENEECSHYHIH